MGVPVNLISAIGKDIYGQLILKEAQDLGINMSASYAMKDFSTGCYMALLENDGDMEIALSGMDILNTMTVLMIKERERIILESSLIVIDTNIPQESIEYIAKLGKDYNIPVFVDLVSKEKSKKTHKVLEYFDTIKANRYEMEEIMGFKLNCEQDMETACSALFESGVKNMVITLGKQGFYYWSEKAHGLYNSEDVHTINTIGAGDAFMSGLVIGAILGMDIEESCKIASTWASRTVQIDKTVDPDISLEKLLNHEIYDHSIQYSMG